MIKNVCELQNAILRAFEIATTGRKGPVLIDITRDCIDASAEYQFDSIVFKNTKGYIKPPQEKELETAVSLISSAKRPLLYIGGGLNNVYGAFTAAQIAKASGIPVVSSLMGICAFDNDSPQYLGMTGMYGSDAANFAMENCDLLIAAGVRFSERAMSKKPAISKDAKIIHIDIDECEIDKNVHADLPMVTDAADALLAITDGLLTQNQEDWLKTCISYKKNPQTTNETLSPYNILANVKAALGDAVVVTDVGQHQMFCAKYYGFNKPKTFITSGGLGAMGFGMGAACGAVFANPDLPVVLITGDGSFHMDCIELVTAVTYKLPIIVIIMNNNALGLVRQLQDKNFGKRHSETEPKRCTNFSKLAKAYGAKGFAVKTREQLKNALEFAKTSKKPCVIDCKIDKNENV